MEDKKLANIQYALLDAHFHASSKDLVHQTDQQRRQQQTHQESMSIEEMKESVSFLNLEDFKYGRTALHIAAEKGYHELAKMLIVRGADMVASGDYYYGKT